MTAAMAPGVAQHRILLVEDNPDDELLTIQALRDAGLVHPIDVVRDGAEALDYLFTAGQYAARKPMTLPQLVLLDLKLPKLNGLEVLKEVRSNERCRLLPIVILTSSDEEQDIVGSYRNGCNSYVCKPVESDEFARVVRDLGLYWIVINRVPATGSR